MILKQQNVTTSKSAIASCDLRVIAILWEVIIWPLLLCNAYCSFLHDCCVTEKLFHLKDMHIIKSARGLL